MQLTPIHLCNSRLSVPLILKGSWIGQWGFFCLFGVFRSMNMYKCCSSCICGTINYPSPILKFLSISQHECNIIISWPERKTVVPRGRGSFIMHMYSCSNSSTYFKRLPDQLPVYYFRNSVIDWLIIKCFTPYHQYFGHITAEETRNHMAKSKHFIWIIPIS